MRRIFPSKPVPPSCNNSEPNSTTNSVQKDIQQPKQPTSVGGNDETFVWGSAVVDNKGRDNLKGLKENSLGAQLRREHSFLLRHLPSGEENLPFATDRRAKISSKLDIGEEIYHHKLGRSSSSSSIYSTCSSQRNLNSFAKVSKNSTGSGDVLVQGIKSTSLAVSSNGHVEGKRTKRTYKSTKTHWMERSISVRKDRPEETNAQQSTASPWCNSLGVSEVPERFFDFCYSEKKIKFCTKDDKDKSILGEPAVSTVEDNEVGTNSGGLSHMRSLEQVSMEVPNVIGLTRSQSFSNLTDSYGCLPNLAEKLSIKQHGSSTFRPVVTSGNASSLTSRNSVADKFSCRYQSARTVAERLVRALPGNSKSLTTKTNNTDINKPLSVGSIAKDEDGDGASAEISLSASDFRNRYTCGTEEGSSSSKLSEGSSPSSQGLGSEDHRSISESISGFFDSISQIGRIERSLVNLREMREDRDRLIMCIKSYENIAAADEELERRAQAAEEQALLLSKEIKSVRPHDNGMIGNEGTKRTDLNVELLQQKIKDLSEEKRNLAIEVASEIRNRMSERSTANEILQLIECRLKMVEKEKNAQQVSLEKELDRRTRKWDSKLEKIKVEEKRLRDRVRDLAEQNVGLQREVSHLNKKENNLKSQLSESEFYMDNFKTKLKEADNEITKLRQSLMETCNQAKLAEDDLCLVKRGYDVKEKENYALQKSINILQRLCKDQERTIAGLYQGLAHIPQGKNYYIPKLQQELTATGAEKALWNNWVNHRCEIDALRQEDTNLLERLRKREEDGGSGLIKFDRELWTRLDGLQTQALSLLEENSLLCAKLLETIKNNNMCHGDALGANSEEPEGGLDLQERIVMVDHEMNVHRLRRKVESYKKSIQMAKGVLKGKTLFICNETVRQDIQKTEACLWEFQSSEAKEQFGKLQQELIGETLLSRLLRESLCSKDAEVEQLQEEVAALVMSRDLFKSETVRLQDLLCSANHKGRNLELKLKRKEERVSCLEADLQRRLKELTVVREELTKVSKERDTKLQKAEQLGWEVMRLNNEVEALKKKVEKLDEDVMVKDGEISILRESLKENDF